MTSPACIRLRLLGRPVLTRGADPTPVRLSTRKVAALAGYLAMSPDQSASREELATLLWGSCSDQQARQSLRQALVFLRKDLASPDYVVADNNVVRLPPDLWSVDALEFESLSKSSDPDELARAAGLFCGDFLAGLNIEEDGYAEWVRAQRARTEAAAARLCETFARQPELVIDPERAVAATDRLLALDPLREDWQRHALTLYARYRGKSEALAKYDAFARLLRQDLDVAPERETDKLAARIRDGEILPAIALRPAPVVADELNVQDQANPAVARVPRRSHLAAAAVLVMLATAGIVALAHYRAAPDRVAQQPPAAAEAWRSPAAPLPDLWRSPPLPSRTERGQPGRQGDRFTSIAVLPFHTHNGSAGTVQSAADVLTDDLTNTLSRVSNLRVISRQTTARYQGRQIDIAAVGAELQVRYVLEGTVRIHGDILRVNVELIDPVTRLPAWSAQIDRADAERHTVLDEIVARLGRELHFEVLKADSERASINPDIFDLSRLGWKAIFDHAVDGMAALTRAEKAFSQILARDPQHWGARAGMGAYHVLVGSLRLALDWSEHLDKGEQLLGEVIRERPNEPGPYFYSSIVQRMRGRIPEAVKSLERCIEITPSAAPCYAHIGHALVQLGRAGEGVEHINYALRLSPQDATRSHWLRFAGEAEIELGRYGAAVAVLRQSYAANRRQPLTLRSLAAALALAGNIGDAQKIFAELKALAPQVAERAGNRPPPFDAIQPELNRGLRITFEART